MSARGPARAEWFAAPAIAVVVAVLVVVSPTAALIAAVAPIGAYVAIRHWRWLAWPLTFEMVLGGWGHAVTILGVPARHVLFAVTLASWGVGKVLEGDWRLRGGRFAWAAGAFLACVLVTVLLSVAWGHPLALEDGLTSAFILLFFPFVDIAARPGGTERLLRQYVLAVAVLAVVQIALTASIFVGWINPHWLAVVFERRFGGITPIWGNYWRVFMVGTVFLQVIILLLVAVRVGGATILSARADRAALMATSFALLLTYTRGFWLSTLLGLAVIFVLTGPRGRVRFAAGALVGVLGLIALAQVADVGLVDSLVRRIVKTFDPDRDISVALRLDLYPRLLARIAERPIFGYGFGLLVENQTYYENSYLYFLIKMGIAGTLVVLWSWLLPLREASRLAHLGNDAYARAVSAGLAASLVSMLAVTAINPFINSSPGLYFLAVTCAALHAFRRAARPHAIGARGGGGSASW